MKNKLLLFTSLVIILLCSAFVESFPNHKENYRLGAYQVPDWPSIQNLPQNLNYHPDSLQIPSQQWTNSQTLPQYQNLNPVLQNVPNYYPDQLSQVSQNHKLSQQNNVWSENSYTLPQSFDTSPEMRNTYLKREGHQQNPAIQNINDAPIESWWNIPQQQGQNPLADTLLHNYMYPYPNQQQQYFQNYDQHLSYHTPIPVLGNPVDSFNNYGQGWPPQNQYQATPISNLMEYPAWPVSGHQNIPTSESQQTEALNGPKSADTANSNAKPVKVEPEAVNQNDSNQFVPTQHPVIEQDASYPKRFIIVHINGTYEHVDNIDHILVDVPDNNSKSVPNHVLAIIEVESNLAPETEYQQPLEQPYDTGISKIPQDTNWSSNNGENSGVPQSSNSDAWGKQLYKSDSIIPTTTEDTTSYIMNYFQPKYIMPIESTTENSYVSSSTDTSQQPAEVYQDVTTDNNNSGYLYTPQTTKIPQSEPNVHIENERNTKTDYTQIQSTTDRIIDSSTDKSHHNITENNDILYTSQTTDTSSVKNFDEGNANYFKPEYIMPIQSTTSNYTDRTTESTTELTQNAKEADDKNKRNKYNSNDYKTTQKSVIAQSGEDDIEVVIVALTEPSIEGAANAQRHASDVAPAESFPIHTPKPIVSDNGQTFPNADTKQSFEQGFSKNSEYEQTTPSPLANNNAGIGATPTVTKFNSQEPGKLREDIYIDPGELKTVVDKPIVWFRPDEQLWDKVTKGEKAFDALALYKVECQPQLIERFTTVHHYPNGTEVIDYIESVWNSPADLNPREVNSNRIIRNA